MATLHSMNTQVRSDPERRRHGGLTIYLIVMMFASSWALFGCLFDPEGVKRNLPNMPEWGFVALSALCLANIVCLIALFRWKKWGF